MPLDIGALTATMLAAAKGSLTTGWNTAEPFAKTQFTNIAQQIVDIGTQLADGQIDQDEAALLIDMQKNASRAALLAVEGIGLLAAQDAINAALAAVATTVNAALGFSLL